MEVEMDKVPISKGLLLDLDASHGIELEENDRICSWQNKITGNGVATFVKQDKGRTEIGSGRPALKRNTADAGGNNTVVFHRQELVNDNEDALSSQNRNVPSPRKVEMSPFCLGRKGFGVLLLFFGLRNLFHHQLSVLQKYVY